MELKHGRIDDAQATITDLPLALFTKTVDCRLVRPGRRNRSAPVLMTTKRAALERMERGLMDGASQRVKPAEASRWIPKNHDLQRQIQNHVRAKAS